MLTLCSFVSVLRYLSQRLVEDLLIKDNSGGIVWTSRPLFAFFSVLLIMKYERP